MKYLHLIIITLFVVFHTVYAVAANDNPEEILKKAAVAEKTMEEIPLVQGWKGFVQNMNLGVQIEEGVVITVPDRHMRLSYGESFTKVGIGQPGWIESRVAAFEQAELEAKMKIIRSFEEDMTPERSLEHLENATWSDGTIREIKELGQVAETLSRLGKKTLALTEASLDRALEKVDPDYNPEKYVNKTPAELKIITEDLFKRKIRSTALQTLIGVTPVYSAEREIGGAYTVMVGVIWSPKLNRLAMSLMNDEYSIPAVSKGKKVVDHLPKGLGLLPQYGTRIVIDDKRHYVVMAYAQAQPRRTAPSRVQIALHDAKKVAANRARAQIINFIQEGLALNDEEVGQELSREYSDMMIGTETLRQIKHQITSRRKKVKLKGVYVLKEWHVKHPESGQDVVGSVVVWSPSSTEMSRKIMRAMKNRPKSKSPVKLQNKPRGKSTTLESMPVDTSAY